MQHMINSAMHESDYKKDIQWHKHFVNSQEFLQQKVVG